MTRREQPPESVEWLQYTPEIIEAIRAGYLDPVLMQIAGECQTRRSLVDYLGRWAPRNKTPKGRAMKRRAT